MHHNPDFLQDVNAISSVRFSPRESVCVIIVTVAGSHTETILLCVSCAIIKSQCIYSLSATPPWFLS